MWSWRKGEWAEEENGCKFTVPKQPGRLQKDSASFDECEEFENERLVGGIDAHHVVGHDWHVNAIAGGESEAWLYASKFDADIWYVPQP